MEIVKGTEIAKAIRKKIRKSLKGEEATPVLCIIRAGEEELSVLYENSLRECFRRAKMEVRTVVLPADTDRETFLTAVASASASSADGVIALKPFPEGVSGREIGALIDPSKDVDGLGYFAENTGGRPLPATAGAVFEILKALGICVRDKNTVVVGRSETVGRPAASEAIRLGASVTLLGSKTGDLPEKLRDADIVISAAGVPGLIRGEYLKEGAVLLDAGLARGIDGKMKGDCDRDSVSCKAAILTPPVGGIGQVTAAVTALHTAESFLRKRSASGSCEIRIRYISDEIEKLRYIDGKSDWIDLRAAKEVELRAGEMKLIPLGVAMKLPEGYEAHVAARSSTYKNFGVVQANAVGIIDETYCGNDDQWFWPALAVRDTVIRVNDRICQFRIEKHQPAIVFREVSELADKNRGGFGTTGVR